MASMKWLFASAIALGVSQPVLADEFTRDRNQSVRERPHPEFEPIGIPVGSFLLLPKLNITAVADSNIFAEENQEDDDSGVNIVPQFRLESRWSRHQVNVTGGMDVYRWARHSTENQNDWTLRTTSRLDVTRNTTVDGLVRFSRATEPRYEPGAPSNTREPVRFDLAETSIGAEHTAGRFRLRGKIESRDYNYDDAEISGSPGVYSDQDVRDRKTSTGKVEIGYALSPGVALTARVEVNKRDFKLSPPRRSIDGDSSGWTAEVGTDFEYGGLSRGFFYVGYLEQDFDAPTLGTASGLSVDTQLEWFPSQLTTVTISGSRSVDDVALSGSPIVVVKKARLTVDHELLRNLIITGDADWRSSDYRSISRSDDHLELSAEATWLLNRRVGLYGGYAWISQDSSGILRGPRYDISRLELGFNLQY